MTQVNHSSFGVPIPHRFRVTRRERKRLARRAYHYGKYPAWHLHKFLGKRACLYSLKWHNLFLTKADAHKSLIYDKQTLDTWKAAISKYLKPPYFFCIEVGVEGEIHVHVIADIHAGLLKINRGGKVIKPIDDTEEDWLRVVSYMYKTAVPLTVDFDDIDAAKLPDWQQRLVDYKRAMYVVKLEGRRDVYQLTDYVFK